MIKQQQLPINVLFTHGKDPTISLGTFSITEFFFNVHNTYYNHYFYNAISFLGSL